MAEAVPLHSVEYGASVAGFIPLEASIQECESLTTKQANMSTPEALEQFPQFAGFYQQTDRRDIQSMKDDFFHPKFTRDSRRKLAAATTLEVEAAKAKKEIHELA